MARLLLEDVTLQKEEKVIAHVRFRGGAQTTIELPLPLPFCELSITRPEVVEAIDELLGDHEYQEIADLLNARGLRSGDGRIFNRQIVGRICKQSGMKSRRQRLREKGLLTLKELARKIRVKGIILSNWRREGTIVGYRSNRKNEYLYVEPAQQQIAMLAGRRRDEQTS